MLSIWTSLKFCCLVNGYTNSNGFFIDGKKYCKEKHFSPFPVMLSNDFFLNLFTSQESLLTLS